jgi:hypothetical protein
MASKKQEIYALSTAIDAELNREYPRLQTKINYLIVLDLAAIFKYATGLEAGRTTNNYRGLSENYDSGLFWNFAKVVWKFLFPKQRGLSQAIKKMRAFKDIEESPIIHNVHFRQPEWQLF